MVLQGVQQSKLAEAFGPEGEESQGNEGTPGKAERMQIGDALVALLESHRKHRSFLTQLPFCIGTGTSRNLQSCFGQSLSCPSAVSCLCGCCLELLR